MLKNPYYNAILAAAYIALIVLLINGASVLKIPDNTILIPIIMLSLLVLSVAIMGILFFYEPARLFLENQRREALVFFGKSAAVFACFILILVVTLLYVSKGAQPEIHTNSPAPVSN